MGAYVFMSLRKKLISWLFFHLLSQPCLDRVVEEVQTHCRISYAWDRVGDGAAVGDEGWGRTIGDGDEAARGAEGFGQRIRG